MNANPLSRLRQFLIDPIVPITYLIGFLLIVTGIGGLAGYEPDVPYGMSILDIFYGALVVGVAWWMTIAPANPRPRWIISFLVIVGSLGGLLVIDAPYGASMLIMAPALITVMASGQFAALFLYPLFLIFAISIGRSDGEILTPGGISFNVLVIVTLWAARNQGMHATRLAWQAQQAALQAEERTEHEAQLRHFLRLFQHERPGHPHRRRPQRHRHRGYLPRDRPERGGAAHGRPAIAGAQPRRAAGDAQAGHRAAAAAGTGLRRGR